MEAKSFNLSICGVQKVMAQINNPKLGQSCITDISFCEGKTTLIGIVNKYCSSVKICVNLIKL